MSEQGVIKFSDEVYTMLAAMKACETDGIVGMSSTLGDGFVHLIGLKNQGEGAKLHYHSDKTISFDLYVTVRYGYRIPDVTLRLQEQVKSLIEEMTETTVSAVNVYIQNIIFDDKTDQIGSEMII